MYCVPMLERKQIRVRPACLQHRQIRDACVPDFAWCEATRLSQAKRRMAASTPPGRRPLSADQKSFVNTQYRVPDSTMAAGSVSTQAIARLRIVASCKPEPLAAMVPATPEESTCVVETGRP